MSKSNKKAKDVNREPTEFEKGLADLKEEFSLKGLILFFTVTILSSVFLSGLLIQIFRSILGLQDTVGLLSAFRYGAFSIIGLPISILFVVLATYSSFRIKRSLKKDYNTNRERNYDTSEINIYGSGGYQKEQERTRCWYRGKEPKDLPNHPYILGRGMEDDMLYALRDDLPSINGHMAIFGSSGSGKSAAIVKNIVYQALEKGKSLIITDSKGDLYADTSNLARAKGFDVKILNLKSTELKNSDGCDMLKTLADDDVKASVLADTIIRNAPGGSGKNGLDFWASNAMNLLKAFLLYVSTNEAYKKAGKNNLAEVYNLINSKSLDEIHEMFGLLDDDHPAKPAYNTFKQAEPKVQGQILNELGIRLQVLGNKWARRVVSADEIDLLGPMKHKCIYYVVISDMDETFKFIASLFFSLLFIELCDFFDYTNQKCKKEGKPNPLLPVDFILDEYANTGAIPGMNQKISTVRSRRIGITMILQDKGQLVEMYTENMANTILNNIPIKILLKTTDLVTAKYFSDLLGIETVRVRNKAYIERSTTIFHAKDNYKVTEGLGKRNLENPDELINSLDPNHLIVCVSGFHPVKLKKYFFFEHPMDKECTPSVPREHLPKWRAIMEGKLKPQKPSGGVTKKAVRKAPEEEQTKPVAKKHNFDDEEMFPE